MQSANISACWNSRLQHSGLSARLLYLTKRLLRVLTQTGLLTADQCQVVRLETDKSNLAMYQYIVSYITQSSLGKYKTLNMDVKVTLNVRKCVFLFIPRNNSRKQCCNCHFILVLVLRFFFSVSANQSSVCRWEGLRPGRGAPVLRVRVPALRARQAHGEDPNQTRRDSGPAASGGKGRMHRSITIQIPVYMSSLN